MTGPRSIANAFLLLLGASLGALVSPAQSPQYIPVDAHNGPRHLLLVLPPGSEEPSSSAIARGMKRIPSDWLVAVLRPDGTTTAYVNRDGIKDALKAALAAHAPAGSKSEGELFELAGAELAQLPGQKIVLIEDRKGKSAVNRASMKPLFGSSAVIYLIDGGQNVRIAYNDSWGYSRGPSPQGDDFLLRRKPFVEGSIHHEVKLSSAVKDIVSAYGER